MKNASRRRPEVEPLESMLLLSTLVAGPHQVASFTMLPAGSAQFSSPGKAQAAAHPTVTTAVLDRSLVTGLSTKLGAASKVVITPGHLSTTATATTRTQGTTRIQAGPPIAGTVHAMIVPAASKPVIVAQVASPVATAPQSPLAKAEAQFAAAHPSRGAYRA